MNTNQALNEADVKLRNDSAVMENSEEKETPKQVFIPAPSSSISQIHRKDESAIPAHSTPETQIGLDQSKLKGHTSHQPSGERSSPSSFRGLGKSMENLDSDKCVWVYGINEHTTIVQLKDLCRPYGKAMIIRLFKQKNKSATSALVAMVKMATTEDADTLINRLPLHFDRKLNVTVTKKTKQRQKRESHPSSSSIHTGSGEEDMTKVKKQRLERNDTKALNQFGEPQEPLKKSNSWSLLRNSIEDLQCMGFSVLEGFTCLDGEEEQIQKNKDSGVKEHFPVKFNPLQDAGNSLTNMKAQNQTYPKSTEEFTRIMRKYLVNLLGNEAAGPIPKGSHDHPYVSKEVKNTSDLPEMGSEVIHERIKENYTHIKEWILTTCVPLSMAFKMSQTEVNKEFCRELLSGALKCLLGIVHQIPQLKVRDLELADEYERKKLLTLRKEVITNDAGVQVLPETVSQIIQTLQVFTQSKVVQTELQSKVQQKYEKIEHSKNPPLKDSQLGGTAIAKSALTTDISKPGCSKIIQTESSSLPKEVQDEFDNTKGLVKISSSSGMKQQYNLSNIDSYSSSGNFAKSMSLRSHTFPDTQVQQDSCATESEMQNRTASEKPLKSKGTSSGTKGKDIMNSLVKSSEIGNSLVGAKSTPVIVIKDEDAGSVRESEAAACFIARSVEKRSDKGTRNSEDNMESSLIEGKCVKGEASKGQMAVIAEKTKSPSLEGKCVKGKACKEQMASIAKESKTPSVDKCVEGKAGKGQEMARIAEERKSSLIDGKDIKGKASKEQEKAGIAEGAKRPSVNDKCIKGKASKGQEMVSIVEKTESLLESSCTKGKASKKHEMASIGEEKRSPVVEGKYVNWKGSMSHEIAGIGEEAKSPVEEVECLIRNVNKEEKIGRVAEEGKTPSADDKSVKEKARKGQEKGSVVEEAKSPSESVVEEAKTPSIDVKHVKEQKIANIAEETKSVSVDVKCVKEKANEGQDMMSIAEGIKSLSVEGKHIKEKTSKEQEIVSIAEETKGPTVDNKYFNGKASEEQEMAGIAEETGKLMVEIKHLKEEACKQQKMGGIAEGTKITFLDNKGVKRKASKEQEMADIVKEARRPLVESKHLKEKASEEQEIVSVVEETRRPSAEGKFVKGKAAKGQEIVSVAKEMQRPLVERKCVKGRAAKEQEMASVAKKKKMEDIAVKGKGTSVSDIEEKSVEFESREVKDMAVDNYEEVMDPARNTVKDKGVTDSVIRNRDTKKCEVKEKGPNNKTVDPEGRADAVSFKSECIEYSEFNDKKRISRLEECKRSENINIEHFETANSGTMVGTGNNEVRDSKSWSNVPRRTNELSRLLEDSVGRELSISREKKVRVKCITSPRMILHIDEFQLNEESRIRNTDFLLSRENATGRDFTEVESNRNINGKHHINVSDCPALSETVKMSTQAVEGKLVKMEIAQDSLNWGVKRSIAEVDCMGKSQFSTENKRQTVLRKKAKVDEIEMCSEKSKSSGMDDDGKQGHCHRMRSLTTLDGDSKLRMVESKEADGLQSANENLQNESHLGIESVQDHTQTSGAPKNLVGVGGRNIQSYTDAEDSSVQDHLPAGRTDRFRDNIQPRRRLRLDIQTQISCTDEQEECSHIKNGDNSEKFAPRRSKVEECSPLKNSVTPAMQTRSSQDEPEECRQTRSRDGKKHIKARSGDKDEDKQKSGGGIKKGCKSVRDLDHEDRSQKSDQTRKAGDKSEGLKEKGRGVKVQSTGGEEIKDEIEDEQEECLQIKDRDNSEMCTQSRSKLEECSPMKSSDTPAVQTQRSQDKSKECRQTRSRDGLKQIETRAGDLDEGTQKSGESSEKECKLIRDLNLQDKSKKSGQTGQPNAKSKGLKDKGRDVKVKSSGRERIKDKIEHKCKKEDTKREKRQRSCKESKDIEEGQRCTEKEMDEETQGYKEIANDCKLENHTQKAGNIDEKCKEGFSSKLEGRKRVSKDWKNEKPASECKQEKVQGKHEDEKQTREVEQVDVKLVSKEAIQVSSGKGTRDALGSSSLSKEDGVMTSRRDSGRKKTTEGSNSCIDKGDSGAAIEGRQAACKRKTSSITSSSHSSSHEPQKQGGERPQRSLEAVPQTCQRRSFSSKRKDLDIQGARTRVLRSRSPVSPVSAGRNLRSRKPFTPSKLS